MSPVNGRCFLLATAFRLDGLPLSVGRWRVVHVPFLHRDDQRLPFANRFAPDTWLEDEAARWPLIPFSAGPAECPAKNLVLLFASEMLAFLIGRRHFQWPTGRGLDLADVPATFDHFSLSLEMREPASGSDGPRRL